MPNYARLPVEFVRGEGSVLYDVEGSEYLDFLTGISVCNLGHCHPDVVSAVMHQIGKLDHVSNIFYTEPALHLARQLSECSLGGKVFFSNSGAEANEAAIKLARKAKPRGEIVVLEGGFHGRTYGALSATPQPPKQEPFAPLVPGFISVPPEPDAVAAVVGGDTAAVLIEPVQGESGISVRSDDLLAAARAACDRSGALLIFDEVQCGMGRTGKLWAYEHTEIRPDAITVAKALGSGLPIGALIASPEYADVFQPGDHGTTFGGGPVVAVAALATLEAINNPELLENVSRLGERFRARLATLPSIEQVYGRGLMVGADVECDAFEVVRSALSEHGLVINATGPRTLRFLPPLTVSEADIDQALVRLGKVLT